MRNTSVKYTPVIAVRAYKLVRAGVPLDEVAKIIGAKQRTFYYWVEKHDELKEAVRMAGEDREADTGVEDWVFGRLTPHLQELWKRIKGVGRSDNAVVLIEDILRDEGTATRQRLFLHALCVSSFSPTKAMRRLNLSKKELDGWIENDVGFAELVGEIRWHKGNFYEEALNRLVGAGDVAATIFANRTYNTDRGYGVRTGVDVRHSGGVVHGVLDLAEIAGELSDACKAEVLAAIRKKTSAEAARLTPIDTISRQIAAVGERG